MIEINGFAFCYFASDVNIVVEQEKEVTKLSSKYVIERWYRHDRAEKYASFSQMVNDAIDDTDSEFMIFCNPKTKFTSEDIESILEKLSNGYCFASVVNFGFFGFSKELIRRIGMMDERFICGEFEDNDFAIRLIHFGKAVWMNYDFNNKYEKTFSKSGNLKHITYSIFHQKYEIVDDTIYIDKDFFNHKKISKRHREYKSQIFNSWNSSDMNVGDSFVSMYFGKKTILVDRNNVEKNVDIKISLDRKINNFRIEIMSEDNITIYFFILKNLQDGRYYLWNDSIKNNFYNAFTVFDDKEVEIRLFLGDNQIYNTVLNPVDNFEISLRLPTIVKNKLIY